VCLAVGRVAAIERGATPGYVKLLLPPRQSRGNSHFGLADIKRIEIPQRSKPLTDPCQSVMLGNS
jgi:hypothetical protein